MSIRFEIQVWVRGVNLVEQYTLMNVQFNALYTGTDRDIRVDINIGVQSADMKEWAAGNVCIAGDAIDFQAYQVENGGDPELIWQQALTCQEMDFTWSPTAMIYTIQGKGTRS